MKALRLCVSGVIKTSLRQNEMTDADFKDLALKLAEGCQTNFGCTIDFDESGCPSLLHFTDKYKVIGAESLWKYLTTKKH